MTPRAVIAHASLAGVTLSFNGPDRLGYHSHGRPLSADLRALLTEHKAAVLALLSPPKASRLRQNAQQRSEVARKRSLAQVGGYASPAAFDETIYLQPAWRKKFP